MVSLAKMIVLLLFLLSHLASAQTTSEDVPLKKSVLPLPEGFSGIMLGSSFEEVQDLLKESPYFLYRGEPDVYFPSATERTTIVAQGREYVERALFHFSNKNLIIITLFLNAGLLDYYTMYTTLSQKYGDPLDVNPQVMRWRNETFQLVLEKPLIIKYIRNTNDVEQSPLFKQTRDEFLQEF